MLGNILLYINIAMALAGQAPALFSAITSAVKTVEGAPDMKTGAAAAITALEGSILPELKTFVQSL